MAIGTDRPNILIKVFEDYIFYSLFGQPGFCLIFILSKNKVFQSGALLKMPPSSIFMKEFDQQQKHTKKVRLSTLKARILIK